MACRAPEAVVFVDSIDVVDPDKLKPAQVVVTNPPRTGMDQRVTDAIAASHPKTVAYISCDPATLARDLSRLLSGLPASPPPRLAALRAFDLFPQTSHVESVAILEAVG